MAIDFGRMFRNVATGYLSAKIANTEANDKLNAEWEYRLKKGLRDKNLFS